MRHSEALWTPKPGLVLVLDTLQADGSFLLSCLLREAQQGSHQVLAPLPTFWSWDTSGFAA